MTSFLTFGDSTYEQALQRIEGEAVASGFFDRIAVKRPADLGKTFWRKHGRFVAASRPGYGYWLWKPWLLRQELAAMPEGGTLVYIDAGCEINGNARKRFAEYVAPARESPTGMIAFRLPLEERRYTKGDVFEALDAWHLKDTLQLVGGVLVMQSSDASRSLVGEWLARAETYHLISDAPSIVPNAADFVVHRHDQSLFSLLSKLAGTTVLDNETHFDDWSRGGDAPFLARRLRGRRRCGFMRQLQRDLDVYGQRLRAVF
jgi:hypothetical protein